jgi:hypothetical protein
MEGSHGAPAGFANTAIFKRKSTKKDPVISMLMMAAVVGIIACVLSIVLSFMFIH